MNERRKLSIYETRIPEALKLSGLISLRNDLDRVVKICAAWQQIEETTLQDACFASSLILYRRCFMDGVRKKLTREDVISIGNNAIEFHDLVYAQANKLIAHSVNKFESVLIGVAMDGDQIAGPAQLSGRFNSFVAEDIRQLSRLSGELITLVLTPKITSAFENWSVAVQKLSPEKLKEFPLRYTAASDPNEKR